METIKKEYRILALAILFFLAGLFFFYNEKRVAVGDVSRQGNVAASQANQPLTLPKFPDPKTFTRFTYKPSAPIANPLPTIVEQCRDSYIALLIFKSNLDYRKDPARASFNRAFPCTRGEQFRYELSDSDVKDLVEGEYYIIAADEGEGGTWYNPRQ